MIGVDRYAEWPRLENAVNDATGTSRLFIRLGFVEVTAPLIDDAATGEAMRRLVTDDLGQLSPDDSLVIFFAGHGHTHTANFSHVAVKTGYVMPVDAASPRIHASASWLRLDSWLSDIARLPPRHILVIIDACHSGVALSAPRWRDHEVPPTDLSARQSRRSRRIITSALDNQRAMDSGPVSGHSLFTGCLIEALSGGLAEGGRRVATGREIGQYLQQRMRSYSQSTQTPDSGEFELDDRGDIVVPIRWEEPARWEPESTSSVTSIRSLWSGLSSVWTAPRRFRDGAKIWFIPSPLAQHVQPTPTKLATPEPPSEHTIKGVGPVALPPALAPNSSPPESMPDDPLRSQVLSKSDGGLYPGHSLFTGCLLEVLSGGLASRGQRIATGREIGQYLDKHVGAYSESRQTPDVGEFEFDDRGDIFVPILPLEPMLSETSSSEPPLAAVTASESTPMPPPLRSATTRSRVITSRALIVAIVVIVVAAVGYVVVRTVFSENSQRPHYTGSVRIESVPSGAEVLFDGTRLPDRTPLTIHGAPVGTRHTIRLELTGYEAVDETVDIPRSGREISVVKTLAPATGKIIIDSTPRGAEIRINGQLRGRTPTTLTGIDMSSTKAIELRLDRYEPLRKDLVWKDGRVDINATLQPATLVKPTSQ